MERYSSYKDSGLEWIGEIPSGWKKSKLKYSTEITMGQSPSSEFYNDEGVGFPFLQGNSEFGDIHPTHKLTTSEITKKSRRGDILFSVRGSVGEINWSDKEYCIGRGLCSISPIKLESKLLWYLLLFSKEEFLSNSVGSTFVSVNTDDVKNLTIPLPPLSEQSQIVQFLDEKTSLIDSLIEKTKRKIELLKEERTSLINYTVTKGLNPNVEMKDSGVEWIGEIPSHWSCIGLKLVLDLLTDFESNGSFSSVKENVTVLEDIGPVWYVRMTDLENGNIRNEHCKYCDLKTYEFLHKTKLDGGELLITKRGEIGKVYLFPKNSGVSTLGPNSYLLKLNEIKVFPPFLFNFYKSDYGQITLKLMDKSTTIGSLYKDDLKNSKIILPPLSEQNEIVSYLDEHTQLIDKTISIEEKRIELLKEYRQSLISEVVTGKIKVVN